MAVVRGNPRKSLPSKFFMIGHPQNLYSSKISSYMVLIRVKIFWVFIQEGQILRITCIDLEEVVSHKEVPFLKAETN